MSFTVLLIIFFSLAMIISGIMLLKKSAKKFNLSKEQLEKIKARNLAQDKEEQENN